MPCPPRPLADPPACPALPAPLLGEGLISLSTYHLLTQLSTDLEPNQDSSKKNLDSIIPSDAIPEGARACGGRGGLASGIGLGPLTLTCFSISCPSLHSLSHPPHTSQCPAPPSTTKATWSTPLPPPPHTTQCLGLAPPSYLTPGHVEHPLPPPPHTSQCLAPPPFSPPRLRGAPKSIPVERLWPQPTGFVGRAVSVFPLGCSTGQLDLWGRPGAAVPGPGTAARVL